MRVLLIMPPAENTIKFLRGWQLSSSDYGTFPPLGLLYIATVLKSNLAKVEIEILDCPSEKINYQQLEAAIRRFKPDVVGITTFTFCLVDVLKTARLVKAINNDTHICLGGPHNANFPEQTLDYPDIDSIVLGEGEYVFLELIKSLIAGSPPPEIPGLYFKNNLRVSQFDKSLIEDLDEIPVLDIGFIKKGIYKSTVGKYENIITLLTSRGCPYQCTFCDTPVKKFRSRSIDNILEEIMLRLDQGFQEIFFYDDTFNIMPERVIDLSEKIIKNKIKFAWSFRGRINTCSYEMLEIAKRSGCQRIHFGVETGTDVGLEELKKGITVGQIKNVFNWCRKLKIKTIADFIIGLPFEKSKEEVVKNIERLISFFPDYAQFNVLQPTPGSQIYQEGVKKGIISQARWEGFVRSPYPQFQPPLWEEYLKQDDLALLLYLAYRKFYLRPGCIARNLFSITTFGEFKRMIFGGIKILFRK
ncbi:MAG: radical SAM protein [Candidatus Omnitrophica bacterium]|nr:radical SAM protein [Candidatus Omnitrophota bacterium]